MEVLSLARVAVDQTVGPLGVKNLMTQSCIICSMTLPIAAASIRLGATKPSLPNVPISLLF